MSKRNQYIILIILTFALYGNTLFNDYALDDTMVITENEYTLSGFKGIDDLLSEEFFSGFFDQKDKKLVAGGRYRPLSMVTFAIEWQLVMGTPFDGIRMPKIKKEMNKETDSKLILPSQKLLKDLSRTIHIENRNERFQSQKNILNKTGIFNKKENDQILNNLEKMYSRRDILLFISHLVNIILYALTVLVLFVLLENLIVKNKSDKWYLSLPFLASLLFLAHPVHTEVVANIKGRDEIMSLLGALLTTLLVFKFVQKQNYLLLLLGFITFLFALFSKEVAITFVAIIPLSIYFFAQEKQKGKSLIISIVPLIIASLIYFYVRDKVVGGISFEASQELMNNSFLGMNNSEKFATIFYTLLLYIKLLFFPHPLTFDYYPYHIPIMNWGNIWPIISLIVYLGIGIYALAEIKKRNIISFGILFYIIALSPMSNILFPIGVFMNERFVYAASIGFVIILAYFLTNKLPIWTKNQNIVLVVLIIILMLYSVKTISRNRVWKNDFTLFTHDVKISEKSAKSNTSAGGKLIEEAVESNNEQLKIKYLNQAIYYLKRAIKIYPEYNDALLLLGNAEWERYQSLDSAFKYYELILPRNPRYENIYSNIFESKMNKVFLKPEKADDNIDILHKLEKYNSTNFFVNYYLGKIYGRFKNNLELSVQYLEKAASINPKNAEVFKDLGVAYGLARKFQSSANAFEKAIKIDSNDPILKVNLAMTYLNLKKYPEAFEVMDSTLNMNYTNNNASALVNLGYLYRNLGKLEKAQQCFDKARMVNPELFNK